MAKNLKKRLDVLLVDRALAESIKKAQALILSGRIKVSDSASNLKPGTLVFENSKIEVRSGERFVSRGGHKLQSALEYWNITAKDQVCLDAGASTGGFTDCLIQNGARQVYAVDVGYGHFHPKLRVDQKVCLYEKSHILKWVPPQGVAITFTVVDLSFISLRKVIRKICEIVQHQSQLLVLFKPQFETDPKFLRKGIVKDPSVRADSVEKFGEFLKECDLKVVDHFACPVLGQKGNQEEWFFLKKE